MAKGHLSMDLYRLRANSNRYDDFLPKPRPGRIWSNVFMRTSRGRRCKDWWEPVPMERLEAPLRRNRGKPVDIVGLMGSGLGFSDRAVEVLAPLVGNVIELLPLDVDGPQRFRFVNPLDFVDCLDEKRSKIERFFNGSIRSVRRYVFKPGSTDGHHLFHCKQWDLHCFVSAEFKARVKESGLVGAYFDPVDR
jgi:hypothetical protein